MRIALLAGAALLFSTAAYSADILEAPQDFSWVGLYAGVNGGYAWAKNKSSMQWIMEGYDFDPEYDTRKLNGFTGGVQLGYNWQINNAILGVETDLQYTHLKTKFNDGFYDAEYENKLNWLGTTRARIGFTPADNLMIYATGGLAYGQIKANVSDYFGFDSSLSKTKFGYAVGAGTEVALSKNWTFKTEYLYANLGKETHRIYGFDDLNYDTLSHKFDAHIVRVGLNYKF